MVLFPGGEGGISENCKANAGFSGSWLRRDALVGWEDRALPDHRYAGLRHSGPSPQQTSLEYGLEGLQALQGENGLLHSGVILVLRSVRAAAELIAEAYWYSGGGAQASRHPVRRVVDGDRQQQT